MEKATKESYFLIYDNCESKVHKVYDIIIKVKYREKQPILLGAKKRVLWHIEMKKQKADTTKFAVYYKLCFVVFLPFLLSSAYFCALILQ